MKVIHLFLFEISIPHYRFSLSYIWEVKLIMLPVFIQNILSYFEFLIYFEVFVLFISKQCFTLNFVMKFIIVFLI